MPYRRRLPRRKRRVAKRSKRFTRSKRTFTRKRRFVRVGTRVGQRFRLNETADMNTFVNLSSTVSVQAIIRFDFDNFPRAKNLMDKFEFFRIKRCTMRLRPRQDANWYWQIQGNNDSLDAVTYFETDGLDSPSTSKGTALVRTSAREHNMRRVISRTWRPKTIQRIEMQSGGPGSTDSVNHAVNYWLPTTVSARTFDRTGLGFFFPAVTNNVDPLLLPAYAVEVSCEIEFKGSSTGT